MTISKKKLFEHLSQEVYCHLGISPVHGIGVFALRAIPKDVNPMRARLKYEEIKYTHKEIKALPRSVRKEIETFCYYDDEHVFVPGIGLNSMNMAVYLNHSKKPNVEYKKNGQLVTLRAIKNGEELFMDYDINFDAVHIFN
jgi:SET domain-containing protein